jgi:predicted sulfurtransferase
MSYKIAALYKFVYFVDPQKVSDTLLSLSKKHSILGALIIAYEGINGTIAGLNDDMDQFIFEMSNSIAELARNFLSQPIRRSTEFEFG